MTGSPSFLTIIRHPITKLTRSILHTLSLDLGFRMTTQFFIYLFQPIFLAQRPRLDLNIQARRKRGAGGARAPHFLADQLTLSQPGGGAHHPHPVLCALPDFQTLRRPCILTKGAFTYDVRYFGGIFDLPTYLP